MALHRCQYRVIYGDTDQMAALYHANHLRLFELGRTEMMAANNFDYAALEREGVFLPVVEAGLKYRSPARYADVLTIETNSTERTRATVRFAYRLLRGEQVLAEGFTVHAATNREGRLVRLPAALESFFKAIHTTYPEHR
jgi:acyl-CoA thioester hydrolase